MNDDAKVIETARNLIARYGTKAAAEADLRATELLEHKETDSHAFWIKVKAVVLAEHATK